MLAGSSDWIPLTDKFYRKVQLFATKWDFELEDNLCVVAANGGPMAVVRNDKKLIAAKSNAIVAPNIRIFTCSGYLLTELAWEGGRLVGMGWAEDESLVCVGVDGFVFIFTMDGEYRQFSLGEESENIGVIDCRIWSTGLVAMQTDFLLVTVTNLDEPRPIALAKTEIQSIPHDWAVLPPNISLSGQPEVYLAVNDTVILVDHHQVIDQRLGNGPFVKMAFSPNGTLVAFFTTAGLVWVVSSDFQQSLSEHDTGDVLPPTHLSWCGTDSVVMWRSGKLEVIGPFGNTLLFYYSSEIALVTEIDGIRVVASDVCDFIQKVPQPVEDVFRIGSTSPAALLFDAYSNFQDGDPKAEELICAIKSDLIEAIDKCLEAAAYEFDSAHQKALLRAVSLGKSFCEDYNADNMVRLSEVLRVLNAVRQANVGMPLSYGQYLLVKNEGLINRLIGRRLHLLAMHICEFLGIPTDPVLIDWACCKIRASALGDEELCETIVDKLSENPGLSYAVVARTAYKTGHQKLAALLLNHEPRAADQVPLLLSMDQDRQALQRAVDSGDTDLVYYVVFQLKRKLPLGDFFRVINEQKQACNLLVTFARQQDTNMLHDFYFQDDRRLDMALISLLDGFEEKDPVSRQDKFGTASKLIDKAHPFDSKSAEDLIRLEQLQMQFQNAGIQCLHGLSVSETLAKLITLGEDAKATKVRYDFKVPDKRYWWISIKALVERRDWEALQKLATSKKSPIGYMPFVMECIETSHFREAAKYIPRCDASKRANLYYRIGAMKEAAEAAFAVKDLDSLSSIRSKISDPATAEEVDILIAQLA